jgi:hypothetical protein
MENPILSARQFKKQIHLMHRLMSGSHDVCLTARCQGPAASRRRTGGKRRQAAVFPVKSLW